MSYKLPLLILVLAGIYALPLSAQLLVADPAFPNSTDQVTITFDATQGTGGLANCGCNVYVHTGVITSASTGPSDWKYVVSTWGQANAAWQMTPVAGQPNKYRYVIGPSIRQYYGVPANEEILQLAFVFRNASGSLEGKGPGGTDIFYDVYPENIDLTVNLTNPINNNFEAALGQSFNITGNASQAANFSILDNGVSIYNSSTPSINISYTYNVSQAGAHHIQLIGASGQVADTSEFFFSAAYRLDLQSPAAPVVLTAVGQNIQISANAYIASKIAVFEDGILKTQVPSSINLNYQLNITQTGTHEVMVAAEYAGNYDTSRFVYVTPNNAPLVDPPVGSTDGITLQSNNGVFLQLYAPNKSVVFVLGDFNNWQPLAAYQMKKANDGATYWLNITGLTPGQNYTFQYLVDGVIRVADPYSTIVLDPNDDPYIPEETYPNLPEYPYGKTTGNVSLIQPGAPVYDWQVDNFTAPGKSKLIVYELLLRDFLHRHDYTTLIDTLDYLQNLGVTAIELMPVSEFEGNDSWGYNPSFHMALDKYYGPINEFKRFVDICHQRGIAVILDVVYNHAFSESPLAQLYWNPTLFKPTPENPWLNPDARHPYSVGYDFNHESPATRKYIDKVMSYWLSEMRVDGFRFDLSKGFTQTNNTDVGAWGAYDASRIAILKHYADVVWGVNNQAYVILEHFADNSEETELQNYGNGMMLWAGFGVHNSYLEAALGFGANFNGANYKSRGWTQPNLMAYMESHDEERMMYKNLNFGNSSGNYNVRNILTGFKRVELASAFFYPIPGPKMIWQFGELGYEYSINLCTDGTIGDCRLSPKPIRWEFYQSPNRRRIYDVVSALTHLKTTYEVFSTSNYMLNTGSATKTIQLFHPDMDVVIQGNFGVVTNTVANPFPYPGWWYEYFTGDSLQVSNQNAPIPLAPGEYRLYTSDRLSAPPSGYITSNYEPEVGYFSLNVSPNPTGGPFEINYTLQQAAQVQISIWDMVGKKVASLEQGRQGAGPHNLSPSLHLTPGIYLVQLEANGKVDTVKMVVGL